MLNASHSRNAIPGGSNYWVYNNSDVNRLIDAVLTARSGMRPRGLHGRSRLYPLAALHTLYLSIKTQVIRAEWRNYTLMPVGIIEAYNRWSMLYMYKSERPEEIVFRIAFPPDILTLNPFMVTDLGSIWVLAEIYDTLVAFSPDLKVVPWMAEKWDVSLDGLNYTFYLRKGVKFHDGPELTADGEVFTYRFDISNKAPKFLGSVFTLVKDVVKIE